MSLDITPSEAGLADDNALASTPLPRATLLLMAAACGASAANIYYNQPLLEAFRNYFHVGESQAALVATAAQVGYGVGMLFFVPLGDLVERRRIVLILVAACALLLVGTALAPSLPALIVLQLFVGAAAMSPQLLIPLAVDLTPPPQRGRAIGALMGGLLCGILLARTVAGVLGDRYGWRAMFGAAAVVMVLLWVALARGLPHRAPSVRMRYHDLMASLIDLLRAHPPLWWASIVSGISFGCFTGFWTVLSYLMHERFHRGATETGLFGIVGLIGAAGAPLAGKLSDRRGPAYTITLSLILTIASFILMGSWVTTAGLIVGVLLMDLGVQSIQVAGQATVMGLLPTARSRMNTIYMVARFTGGASGSALAAAAWTHWRWTGVCTSACAMLILALLTHLHGNRRAAPKVAINHE